MDPLGFSTIPKRWCKPRRKISVAIKKVSRPTAIATVPPWSNLVVHPLHLPTIYPPRSSFRRGWVIRGWKFPPRGGWFFVLCSPAVGWKKKHWRSWRMRQKHRDTFYILLKKRPEKKWKLEKQKTGEMEWTSLWDSFLELGKFWRFPKIATELKITKIKKKAGNFHT